MHNIQKSVEFFKLTINISIKTCFKIESKKNRERKIIRNKSDQGSKKVIPDEFYKIMIKEFKAVSRKWKEHYFMLLDSKT